MFRQRGALQGLKGPLIQTYFTNRVRVAGLLDYLEYGIWENLVRKSSVFVQIWNFYKFYISVNFIFFYFFFCPKYYLRSL